MFDSILPEEVLNDITLATFQDAFEALLEECLDSESRSAGK